MHSICLGASNFFFLQENILVSVTGKPRQGAIILPGLLQHAQQARKISPYFQELKNQYGFTIVSVLADGLTYGA